MKIVQPTYMIVDIIEDSEIMRRLERIGRTCYKSEDRITLGSADRFVRMRIHDGHESVLEHYSFAVRFIVDRGVSHELVRHRIASYSQESTRYCNYAKHDEIAVVMPPLQIKEQQEIWRSAMIRAEMAYMALVGNGAPPEIARSVLPTCLKTEIVMSANLREWRYFLRLRTAPAAHPQMREVTIPLLKELRGLLPAVFDDIEVPPV